METIFDLLEKLSKYDKDEIQYALYTLMKDGKIKFTDLNASYTHYLETDKADKALKLADANSCTLSLLHHFKKENKSNHTDIHWALHNLNESKQFNMQAMNERFGGYNKDEDCKYSFYWREKNPNKW